MRKIYFYPIIPAEIEFYHFIQKKLCESTGAVNMSTFPKGSGKKQKAGTVEFECSLFHFWTALKLHSLGRFTWFKKPEPLIHTLLSTCNRFWKDLGLQNALKLAPTLALKNTVFLSLTENCLELYMMTF